VAVTNVQLVLQFLAQTLFASVFHGIRSESLSRTSTDWQLRLCQPKDRNSTKLCSWAQRGMKFESRCCLRPSLTRIHQHSAFRSCVIASGLFFMIRTKLLSCCLNNCHTCFPIRHEHCASLGTRDSAIVFAGDPTELYQQNQLSCLNTLPLH